MEPQKSSIGSIIGTIIIIAVIILGGLYFWGKRIEESKVKQALVSGEVSQGATVNEAAVITNVTTGDDLGSIEADLKNTNLDNLSTEINTQLQ
ncbi:MAG: hypothetical protein WAX85_01435 [Minisyncoccia bacterium]